MGLLSTIDISNLINLISEIFGNLSPDLTSLIGNVYGIIVLISVVTCVVLIFGIFYSHFGMKVVQRKIDESVKVIADPGYTNMDDNQVQFSIRWKNAQNLLNSSSQNDWARAIIEADIMLDEILEKAGYHGDGVGEKLKKVEKGDLQSLDDAWEAHKVRNALAHEANFILTEKEAKRVMELFRRVFAEYFVI